MKKARKKFEIKDAKNAGSRTKSSGLFHRYFYVTVLILFIGFTILGSSLLIFIARYQSEDGAFKAERADRLADCRGAYSKRLLA